MFYVTGKFIAKIMDLLYGIFLLLFSDRLLSLWIGDTYDIWLQRDLM